MERRNERTKTSKKAGSYIERKIAFIKKSGSNVESDWELAGRADDKTLAVWACDCAERVLPYFEKKYRRTIALGLLLKRAEHGCRRI